MHICFSLPLLPYSHYRNTYLCAWEKFSHLMRFFYSFNYWHPIDLENYFFLKSGNQEEKFMHNRGIISFT